MVIFYHARYPFSLLPRITVRTAVFLAGAALMALEVAAFRIVGRSFGTALRETTTVMVRAQQGPRVRGSTPGGQLDLRLLDRIERGGLVEVFDMFLPADTEHPGLPHGSGVVERVFVHSGTITVGPVSDPLTLGPGDYARYSGDGPHVYRSAGEDVHGVLLVGYPPS